VEGDRRAIRVGAIMLAAIALAGVAVVLLDDVSLHPRLRVTVYMEHVGALQEGAAVQVAGREIGEVRAIQLLPRSRAPASAAAAGSLVALDVRIERRRAHMAPVNGAWFVASRGVLGQRYLEIGPPPRDDARWIAVTDGAEIRGIDPPMLDRLAAVAMQNATELRALMRELAPEWSALVAALDELDATVRAAEPRPGAYASLWASVRRLRAEAASAAAAWDATGTSAAEIAGVVDRAQAELARLEPRLGQLRDGIDQLADEIARVAARLDRDRLAQLELAVDRIRAVVARVDRVAAMATEMARLVAEGRGNLGGFLNDHELADFAKAMNRRLKRQPWELIGHPQKRR
jgi:phospholipid/cholesterol/gamma-HCH transport system substrate-binding protein